MCIYSKTCTSIVYFSVSVMYRLDHGLYLLWNLNETISIYSSLPLPGRSASSLAWSQLFSCSGKMTSKKRLWKKVLGLDNRTFAKRWYCSKNRGYCTRKVQWIETPSCETGHLGGIHTEFSDHCNIFLETNSYCILETIGTPFGKKIQKNGIFPAGSQPSPLSLTSRSHRRISWNTGVSSSPNSVVYPIYKYGLSMLIIVIIPVTKKPVPKKMLKSCVYQCFHSGFRLYMMFQNHFSPGFPTCLLHFGAHDSGGSSTRAAEVPLFADRRQVEVRSRRQVKLRGGGAPRLTGDLVVS